MKRILLVMSMILIALFGCEVEEESPEDVTGYLAVYVNLGSIECDSLKVTVSRGNTSLSLPVMKMPFDLPVRVEKLIPGYWNVEVQALRRDEVVAQGKETVHVSRSFSGKCTVSLVPEYDYSFENFNRTMELVVQEHPYDGIMPFGSYMNQIASAIPAVPRYVGMSDFDLTAFRMGMFDWIHQMDQPGIVIQDIARTDNEFKIVVMVDTMRISMQQNMYGSWNISIMDSSLASGMQNYLDTLSVKALTKLNSVLADTVFHDDYDRIRLVMDSLEDSLDRTDAFVGNITSQNKNVIADVIDDLVYSLMDRVPGFGSRPTVSTFTDYDSSRMDLCISLYFNGNTYRYVLKLDRYGSWTVEKPDLPVWKPTVSDLDPKLNALNKAISDDISDDGQIGFSTEKDRFEYLYGKLNAHLKGNDVYAMMDANLDARFETKLGEIVKNAIDRIPASGGGSYSHDVTVAVDRTAGPFKFTVDISYSKGSYSYTYVMNGDYTWTHSSKDNLNPERPADPNRPDVPGCTLADFNANFQRNAVDAGNTTAPGPGYWDFSKMDKSPLFWTMSDRQLAKYTEDKKAEARRDKLSDYQNDWILRNYRHEAEIVDNEFFVYYSFCMDSKKVCQTVTIQHTDGTWEQRFISGWTDIPSY